MAPFCWCCLLNEAIQEHKLIPVLCLHIALNRPCAGRLLGSSVRSNTWFELSTHTDSISAAFFTSKAPGTLWGREQTFYHVTNTGTESKRSRRLVWMCMNHFYHTASLGDASGQQKSGLRLSCDTLHRKQCCQHSAFVGTSPICTSASFLPLMEPCQVRDHAPMAQVLKAAGITWTLQMFTWAANHCWKYFLGQHLCRGNALFRAGEDRYTEETHPGSPPGSGKQLCASSMDSAEYGLERSANGSVSQQSYMETCLNWKIWQPVIAIHCMASFPWP